MQFDEQGDRIITASEDGTSKIWQKQKMSFDQMVAILSSIDLIEKDQSIIQAAKKLAASEEIELWDALIEIMKTKRANVEK